jgi:hypothetical protein
LSRIQGQQHNGGKEDQLVDLGANRRAVSCRQGGWFCFEAGHQLWWPASKCFGLQRNPLAEEPESPSVSVAGGHRVHLLTHPVERLVVETGLVDASAVPVDRGGAMVVARVIARVVAMVPAWWSARPVATPLICTGRSKANAEQSGNSDSGR